MYFHYMMNSGTDPNPEKALEPQADEYAGHPWAKGMFDALHKSIINESMEKFNEEIMRLWAGHWAKINDRPHWKIALGNEEEELVDEALEAQRERKYKKPRAVLCEDGLIFSLLCIARDLVEADRGSITPAENLIRTLLISANAKPLTPEDVQNDVDEFRDNFETAQETAVHFLRHYPDLVQNNANAQ